MTAVRRLSLESDEELVRWFLRFFKTGDASPFGRRYQDWSTTETVVNILENRDAAFVARVSACMPALLLRWTPEDTVETCRRMCDLAIHVRNPGNVTPLIRMFRRAKDQKDRASALLVLKALVAYRDDPATHGIFLSGLRTKVYAATCMRALCMCRPEIAAERFKSFLSLTKLEIGPTASIIRCVPATKMDEFLALVGNDDRVKKALARGLICMPLVKA